ncbi:3-isopropylmalate dehydratase small subunit [uncultured Maricaulis sp.]|uniref:3-isopropylmalate dehydratase small subunit n=1 Tax=uncultured Maricaulis sp. TaxID=174710 RepID=UPI0030DD80F8|tara:strand:- start:1876 stop:2463 length:588 start_codon:yes stop_codon:yes gene_type:complete
MSDNPVGFTHLHSRTFTLPQEDIDTDQIIPARFLTTTTQDGLGRLAFHDWRYDEGGKARDDCALNTLDTGAFAILVAGRNFGCGSSREHAPWALHDFGVRAVISSEIADIFRSNAAKNNIIPIIAPPQAHAWLLEHEGVDVKIDLERQYVDLGNGPGFHFEIEPFARHCLIEGTDPLGFLLSHQDAITAYEARSA